MSIERSSAAVRVFSRHLIESVPPIEGALLIGLMAVWIFG